MTMRIVRRVKKGRRKRYVRVLPRLNLTAVDAIVARQPSTVQQVGRCVELAYIILIISGVSEGFRNKTLRVCLVSHVHARRVTLVKLHVMA